jgi:hypothetical protein
VALFSHWIRKANIWNTEKRGKIKFIVVDPDPLGSETLSRIRIQKKIIQDQGSSGSEMKLKYKTTVKNQKKLPISQKFLLVIKIFS